MLVRANADPVVVLNLAMDFGKLREFYSQKPEFLKQKIHLGKTIDRIGLHHRESYNIRTPHSSTPVEGRTQ